MTQEERTLTVSSEKQEEASIVVEAEGFFPEQQAEFSQEQPPAPHGREQECAQGGWLQTQKAEDFPSFLVLETKRIRPPGACAGSRSEIERSLGQHRKLNGYISKALQSDWEGKLDAKGIDALRQRIETSIDQLEQMVESLDNLKKQRRQMRRRKGESDGDGILKEATVAKVQYFATAFERAVSGAIVNGKISGGRNLDELYKKAKEKYSFTPREELAIFQILADMGYPTFKDRLRIGEDNHDPREGLGEWQKQYHA